MTTDQTTALYDAIDAFQRTHRLPGLQHAQIRGLLAEHLARALPAAVPVPPPTNRAAVRAAALREAADFVGNDDDCDCGGCDSCVPNKLAAELRRRAAEEQPVETQDDGRAAIIAELLPVWEAVYEPGNVSDYLIGYANDQDAATGMAEAWMRSQAEVTGRLEWTPWGAATLLPSRYDAWFELVERHDDGVDTGPGIIVRRRIETAVVEQPDTQETRPVTVHAVPLPGSNGISSCCGRPPCEFVGERVTRDPDKVTCPGSAAP